MKLLTLLLSQQLTKLSDFFREFGEFLSPLVPMLLLTVGVAALTYCMLAFKFGGVVALDDNDVIMENEPPTPPTVTDFPCA